MEVLETLAINQDTGHLEKVPYIPSRLVAVENDIVGVNNRLRDVEDEHINNFYTSISTVDHALNDQIQKQSDDAATFATALNDQEQKMSDDAATFATALWASLPKFRRSNGTGFDQCPSGYDNITNLEDCREAGQTIGQARNLVNVQGNWHGHSGGCWACDTDPRIHFDNKGIDIVGTIYANQEVHICKIKPWPAFAEEHGF